MPSGFELPGLAVLLYIIVHSANLRATSHHKSINGWKHLGEHPPLSLSLVFGKFVRCSAHGHSFARLWHVEVVWTRWASVCWYFVTTVQWWQSMQGGARDQDMVHLLHCLFVFSMHFNFTLSSAHTEGAKN